MIRLAALALLAGCSSLLGIEDLEGPGGPPPPGDGPVVTDDSDPDPSTIQLTGSVTLLRPGVAQSEPIANEVIQFEHAGQTFATTTGTDGSYRFDLGMPTEITGFLRVAESPNHRLSHSYVPTFSGDRAFRGQAFSQEFVMLLAQQANEPIQPGVAFLMLLVLDAAGNPRRDIEFVASASSRIVYADVDGRPIEDALQTTDAGTAYAFNVPPTTMEVLAGSQAAGSARRTVNLAENGLPVQAFVVFVLP